VAVFAVSPFGQVVRPVNQPVTLIAARRVPPQIAHMVVVWVAIVVTTFHALGARPDKCCKNQQVNVVPIALTERYDAMFVCITLKRTQHLALYHLDGAVLAANLSS